MRKQKIIKDLKLKRNYLTALSELIDLLLNRKNIPELYQEEAQSLARELEVAIKQFNNVIDKSTI
ncbi:hypothetical protein ACVXZ0_17145 [Staphylococcus aureus]